MLVSSGKSKESARWYLEGSSGSGKKYIIPLDKNPFLVGRQKECSLILSSKEISRKHAKIVIQGDDIYLYDLQSTNGTFRNNTRIVTETILRDGDVVQFGNVKFYIYSSERQSDTMQGSNTHFQSDRSPEDDFAAYYELTKREQEILFLLLEGLSTKEIADKLCIADGTAKNHVLSIFKKTSAHSRVTLVNQYNEFCKGLSR